MMNQFNQGQMLTNFLKFKQMFSGDPKQMVQTMLKNGQMSQEQFNRLAKQATELQKMFHLN